MSTGILLCVRCLFFSYLRILVLPFGFDFRSLMLIGTFVIVCSYDISMYFVFWLFLFCWFGYIIIVVVFMSTGILLCMRCLFFSYLRILVLPFGFDFRSLMLIGTFVIVCSYDISMYFVFWLFLFCWFGYIIIVVVFMSTGILLCMRCLFFFVLANNCSSIRLIYL